MPNKERFSRAGIFAANYSIIGSSSENTFGRRASRSDEFATDTRQWRCLAVHSCGWGMALHAIRFQVELSKGETSTFHTLREPAGRQREADKQQERNKQLGSDERDRAAVTDLENVFQRELYESRRDGGTSNLAKAGAPYDGARIAELRVIERVEKLGAKLQ
jgi:hypothetical protein